MPCRFAIGPWVLDTESNTVCRDGRIIRLEPKVVEVCACLAGRAGDVIRKEELIRAVWRDTFVTDDVLAHAISELRKALEDDARQPRFIETIPKRGYRMIAPVVPRSGVPAVPDATQAGVAAAPVADTARGSALGRWVRGGTVMITLAVAVGIAIWVHKLRPALPSDTTVLIGAFENDSGEPVLDGTLQFALERELSNSQLVHVVSPERVQDIVQLMRRPTDVHIDRALALEICRRTPDIRLLITGRAQKIGSRYLFTASIVDPASGNLVRAAEAEAGSQNEILGAIHVLATNVRRELGESILGTPRIGEPLEPVTTRSLRALQLYSEALDQMVRHGTEAGEGIELLREALNQDPDFASAHVMFAHALRDLGDPEATLHFERAFAMAHSASERERLFITGSYYASKDNGDEAFPKAVTAYEELLRHYPDDLWALNNLSVLYEMWGRTEKSLRLGMRIADLRPEMVPSRVYGLAVHSDEATLDRIAAGCDRPSNLHSCQLVFMVHDARSIWQLLRKGDADQALRVAQTLGDHASQAYPKATEVPSLILSDFYMDTGMLQADEKLTAKTLRGNDNAYGWFTDPILIAHYRGDRAAEREALTPYLKYPPDAAIFAPEYVESGRLEDLRGVLRKLEKRDGEAWVYWVSGIVELAERDFASSIDNLRRAKDANEPGGYTAADQLATALEHAGRVDEALDALRGCQTKLVGQSDSDAVSWDNLDGRWHLARLYRQTGHIAEAEAEENSLRAQLKLADPDQDIARALKQLPRTIETVARH
jgi:DNA-binding winged helix-turn-helix (wHTH) protein/tetratricopeptide (TPR) repeat protein